MRNLLIDYITKRAKEEERKKIILLSIIIELLLFVCNIVVSFKDLRSQHEKKNI